MTSDYICPYICSYRTNSGYCGLTGGAENCQRRMFLGYNSETRQFIVEPVAAGNIIVQSFQTNADRIRSAGTEIEMVDIILKLVKKIPEGENKRRTLYQLLMKEADDG